MKRVTASAVAVVAALALVTAILASTASAHTVFCGERITSCPASKVKPAGTYLNGGASSLVGGELSIRPSFTVGTISCTAGVLSTQSTSAGGNPMPATIGASFPPETCKNTTTGKACSSMSFNTAPGSVEATGSGNGIIKIGTATQPLVMSFQCSAAAGGEVACSYKLAGTQLIFNESAAYGLTAENASVALGSQTMGNATCNEPGTLTLKLTPDQSSGYKAISSY